MELNGGVHRHFLTGAEELQASKNNEFIRMHSSTLCKLGFFHSVIHKALAGKLKTASRGFGVTLDRIFERRWAKFIGLMSSVIAVVAVIWSLGSWGVHLHQGKNSNAESRGEVLPMSQEKLPGHRAALLCHIGISVSEPSRCSSFVTNDN